MGENKSSLPRQHLLTDLLFKSSVCVMKKVFYGVAVVLVVVLIILGVMADRKATTKNETNSAADSFNADQLQDAAEKTPAPN